MSDPSQQIESFAPEDEFDDEEESILNHGATRVRPAVVFDEQDGSDSDRERDAAAQSESDSDGDSAAPLNEYATLIDDEFGDFQLAEKEREGECWAEDTHAASVSTEQSEPVEALPSPPATATQQQAPSNIPPLDAEKLQRIRDAMSKITIRPPSQSAELMANRLLQSSLRFGDEINPANKG